MDLSTFKVDKDGNYDLDGYDTDQMKELLEALRSGQNEPPRKRRKVDGESNDSKAISKSLRKTVSEGERRRMEKRKNEWFGGDEEEKWGY